MALAELRRLTSGRLLRLALTAMLLIPSLYAGLYLYANKDPYANLKSLPVAVVDEDQGTTLADGKRLQVGDQVTRTLVDRHTFDWHRVSRQEATKGVDEERFDFALIVPKTFSADLASAGTTHPRRATLEQYTNDTNGYLARTISNTVVGEVTRSVAQQVASSASAQMLDGFATIHTKMQQAVSGATTLADGNGRLASGTAELVSGVTRLRDGTTQLQAGATKLAAGADQAHTGSTRLAAGAQQLDGGLATMDARTAALPGQTAQLASGAHQVADGNTQLASGAQQLATGATAASSGAGKLRAGAQKLNAGASALASGAHQVADGNAKIDAAGRLAADAAVQIDATRSRQRAAIEARLTRLQQRIDQLGALAADVRPTNPQQADLLVRVQQDLAVQVATAREQLASLDAQLDGASAKVTGAASSLGKLASGSQQVADGADKLVAGSATLADKLGELQSGTAQLASGATRLGAGATKAAGGASQVAAGADKLAAGSAQLHDGIVQAHTGSTKLTAGAAQLDGGVAQLASGSHTLATKEQQAVDGAVQLVTGTAKLRDGAAQARDGARRLHDEMAKGAGQVPAFTTEQRTAAAQTVGNPVTVHATNAAKADSYGAGLAPFFVSLALWIGAYVLFLLVKALSSRALAAQQPAWRVALSGWMSPALLAAGQSFLAYWLVLKGLDYHVDHPVAAMAFMAFVSLTYAAILHALASRFGAVGKFLGLVLLVVQLVSGGGTFPWQTLPDPLQALHRVLPMSYAIDGLRHLMYGGRMAFVALDVAVLAGYLAVALVASTYAARRARVWTPSRIKPDLVL
nr:YhgE/Pip domain-containing protein [Arsenicicoccus dermatophilus]